MHSAPPDHVIYLERLLNLIGEGAQGVAPGDGSGAGHGGELENGALGVGARGDHANIG
jgi:hypothetical protein